MVADGGDSRKVGAELSDLHVRNYVEQLGDILLIVPVLLYRLLTCLTVCSLPRIALIVSSNHAVVVRLLKIVHRVLITEREVFILTHHRKQTLASSVKYLGTVFFRVRALSSMEYIFPVLFLHSKAVYYFGVLTAWRLAFKIPIKKHTRRDDRILGVLFCDD